MRIAQILHNKAHWIFEAEAIPDWPPDQDGNPIVLVDITDRPEVQEGWDYDGKEFSEPVPVEPGEAVELPEQPTHPGVVTLEAVEQLRTNVDTNTKTISAMLGVTNDAI